MEQNYRALHMAFDSDMKYMEFFTASDEFMPEEVKASLTYGPLTCKPRFLLFVEGEKKDEIEGADYTKLESCVQKYVPAYDEWYT